MKSRILFVCVVTAPLTVGIAVSANRSDIDSTRTTWDRFAAARYLDTREMWWQSWDRAQRDHQTVCISCHTVLPYALARPVLRKQIGETSISAPERNMLSYLSKRVTLWNEVEPFYKDGKAGPTKSVESRDTEAVLNALILANYDARGNHLSPLTESAFRNAWALQEQSGDKAGAWIWLNFHNGPWESDISEYWGATLMALAAGIAPDRYQKRPEIQKNLELLRSYLRRDYPSQPLVNQIVVLWASAKFPGLLTAYDRKVLVREVFAEQQADGGWSATDLGSWERHDKTPLVRKSDGYATGLIVYTLEQAGLGRAPQVRSGASWLLQNQSSSDGSWPAWSLNKDHDPASDTGRFMSDAATGYAVLALEDHR
jgi:squalene-hopene/tetraprenyl-beta-curcumene cyclase